MANPTAGVPVSTTPFDGAVTKRDLAATAQTYYIGEAIGLDSSGNATKCDDTASLKFDGLYASGTGGPRTTVDSGDSAGDKKVYTQKPRFITVGIAETAAAGDEGKPLWWKYSNQVSFFAAATSSKYSNFAGYLHRVISSTEVEVEIGTEGPNLIAVNVPYSSPVNTCVFLADRACRVVDIRGRPTTAAAFTTDVKKVPVNTTITNGTSLLLDATNTPFNFNGTANANQVMSLATNTTTLSLAAGDAIALNVNATATNAVGVISILLAPVAK